MYSMRICDMKVIDEKHSVKWRDKQCELWQVSDEYNGKGVG